VVDLSQDPSIPALLEGETQAQLAGRLLKDARETSGLTILTLSTTTRIQDHYLVAIEAGEFEKLPGDFFVASFIRYIGKELGLTEIYCKGLCQLAKNHYIYGPHSLSQEATLPDALRGQDQLSPLHSSQTRTSQHPRRNLGRPPGTTETPSAQNESHPFTMSVLSHKIFQSAKISKSLGVKVASFPYSQLVPRAGGRAKFFASLLILTLLVAAGLWKFSDKVASWTARLQMSATDLMNSPFMDSKVLGTRNPPAMGVLPDKQANLPVRTEKLEHTQPDSPKESLAQQTESPNPATPHVQGGDLQQDPQVTLQAEVPVPGLLPASHTNSVVTETPVTALIQPIRHKSDIDSGTTPVTNSSAGSISTLRIIAKESVRAKQTCDLSPQQEVVWPSGEHFLEFKESCELLIYDAGSVELFLDDKPLGYLGGKNRVRQLSFRSSPTSQNNSRF
jgi:cytoskeletal protein RodZ